MMDTKIIIGKVRFNYVNAFTPVAMNEGDKPKYSVCILVDKTDKKSIDAINRAVEIAKENGKGIIGDKNGKVPATIKTPLRDGDEERSDDPAFAGKYFLNANSLMQPGIVDRQRQPIINQEDFYSGCYGYASINFFAYNVKNKGIACGLNNLMKTDDGERLFGGPSAEEDFANVDLDGDDDLM